MSRHESYQRNFIVGLCVLIATITSAFSAEPVNIGDRLELFIDNVAIENITGDLQQEVIQPTPEEMVFDANATWEGNASAYWSVFKDDDKFRMVYRGVDTVTIALDNMERACMAESIDGITWSRPNLGLFSYDGNTNNNIVLSAYRRTKAHNLTVFKDTNPNAPAASKYKALARNIYGMRVYESPDCKNWTNINVRLGESDPDSIKESDNRGTFDSQNLAFWDAEIGKYRAYWRDIKDGIRIIVTATSDDCYNWTGDYDLTYTQGNFENEVVFPATTEDLYTNAVRQYYRNPKLYIGFPARLATTETTEPILMMSRDGKNFHRYAEGVIPNSAPSDRDLYKSNYIENAMLVLPGKPNEISIYASENSSHTPEARRIRRFSYRVDGFVALRGGISGGQLTTKALSYSGNDLLLNYITKPGGYVKVEVLNTSEEVIGASGNLTGDVIDSSVTWSNDPGLSSGTVVLRFTVKDADLYSYRFANTGNTNYTLTYSAGSNGSVTGDLSQTVDAGNNGTQVIAVADTDYHFVNWSDGVTTATRTDTDVQNDITVTANFAADGGGTPLTVLEDAEDGDTAGWEIYDITPDGATITNIVDPTDSNNRVISLTGTDLSNGFRYNFAPMITDTVQLQWKMKFSETYEIFVKCQTNVGDRVVRYKPVSVNGLGDSTYIDIGLGESTISGAWASISRNITDDIHAAQPDTDIISIVSLAIRGSGLIDDIMISYPAGETSHSADTNNDWSISQTEVNAFIANYANNSNTVSGGNGSFDDANRITMREVLRVIYLYNDGGTYKAATGTVDNYDIDGPQGDPGAPPPAESEENNTHTLACANSADSGAGSLRNAIANATHGDTITFDESIEKITLTSEILIDKSITIDGNGITIISGDSQTRIFRIYNEDEDIFVLLLNMGIVDGENSADEFGGAIYNNGENLTLENCLLNGNANLAENGKGGALYTSGSVTVTNCVFTDNSAEEENDIYSTNNAVIND